MGAMDVGVMAMHLAIDARRDPGTRLSALDQLRINPGTLRNWATQARSTEVVALGVLPCELGQEGDGWSAAHG